MDLLTTAVSPRYFAHVQQLTIVGILPKPLTEACVQELLHTHFPD